MNWQKIKEMAAKRGENDYKEFAFSKIMFDYFDKIAAVVDAAMELNKWDRPGNMDNPSGKALIKALEALEK